MILQKKKFLIIIILFIAFLILFKNESFADSKYTLYPTSITELQSVNPSMSIANKYWCMFRFVDTNTFYVFVSSSAFYVSNNGTRDVLSTSDSSVCYYVYYTDYNSSTITFDYKISSVKNSDILSSITTNAMYNFEFCLSSHDIACNYNATDIMGSKNCNEYICYYARDYYNPTEYRMSNITDILASKFDISVLTSDQISNINSYWNFLLFFHPYYNYFELLLFNRNGSVSLGFDSSNYLVTKISYSYAYYLTYSEGKFTSCTRHSGTNSLISIGNSTLYKSSFYTTEFLDLIMLTNMDVYLTFYVGTNDYLSTPLYLTNSISSGGSSSDDSSFVYTGYGDYTLTVYDCNLLNYFNFYFTIPQVRSDTRFYIFLNSYNRLSAKSVYAGFSIYLVTTPEGYDYFDYEFYMYYDDLNGNMYLPAGCEILQYSAGGFNDENIELTLVNSYVGERDASEDYYFNDFFNLLQENVDYVNELGLNWDLGNVSVAKTFLAPTSWTVSDFDFDYFFYNNWASNIISEILSAFGIKASDNCLSEYFYKSIMFDLYYSDNVVLNVNDLVCSSGSVISYENTKEQYRSLTGTYYHLFRSTYRYEPLSNLVGNNHFYIEFRNSQDCSDLLNGEIDSGLYSSYLYTDNPDSTSGMYFSYGTDCYKNLSTTADYSQTSNYFYESVSNDTITNIETYIEELNEGTTNNYYYNNTYYTIYKTSDEYLLNNIYTAVLSISTKMDSLQKSVENISNNFTTNISNSATYWFVPTSAEMNGLLDDLEYECSEHLGILYEPVSFAIYTFELFDNIEEDNDIILHINEVSYKDVVLIDEMDFNFTEYLENNEQFKNIYNIYLIGVDFVLIVLVVKYAIKVGKEEFGL